MNFNVSNKPISVFSLSSLTDIVLLLVIFFLLTSQFVIQTGVKVKLPGSKTNEQSEPTQLIVTATSAGAIYVGSEQIGIDRLSEKLNEVEEDSPVVGAAIADIFGGAGEDAGVGHLRHRQTHLPR